MTTQTNAKATPAKSATAKTTPAKEDVADNAPKVEEKTSRIPQLFLDNPIFKGFCEEFVKAVDDITSYNKEVLAEKNSEWNQAKVIAKAKEFGQPDDANAPVDEEIKKALDVWENLITQASAARKHVLEITSKKLGIQLSSTTQRDANAEAPLKEQRNKAVTIGKQLKSFGEMSNDKAFIAAVDEFLKNNEIPMVGRDQSSNLSEGGPSTPKYRVTVTVEKDGNVILTEKGFTKTALALSRPEFGYPRGESLKADKLREVYEKYTNKGENYTEPIKFEDNGLIFTFTKN